MLAGEQTAGAAKPGLDLVADQKHVAGTTNPPGLRQVAGRRHNDPAFTLDRLDQECCCAGGDSGLERGDVAKRHKLESWRERTKARAVLRHGREAHNGDGAAVEIAFRRNDLGAFGRHALELIGPFARRLERSLDRLGAPIRRQCGVHPGKCACTRQKRPEPIGEIGARHSIQLSRLPRHRFDQSWMAMSETNSRVGAHHVDIATTIFVPDMDTLAAHKSDGQRLVIRRAITGFEAIQFAHCGLFSLNQIADQSRRRNMNLRPNQLAAE